MQTYGARHAVAVGSGTDALLLSLKAAGVSEGDEVITTPSRSTRQLAQLLLLAAPQSLLMSAMTIISMLLRSPQKLAKY